MTLNEARTKARALKRDDKVTLDGTLLEVTSADCGVVELCRPEHRDITGSYHRAPVEALAEMFAKGTAA